MNLFFSYRMAHVGVAISILFAILFFIPAMASASVVYDALPNPLPGNAPSQPFQAQQTFEFGDFVHLGGTDRDLSTVTVAMSNWALEATPANVAFCLANTTKCPTGGYIHPITINIYGSHLDTNGVPDTLLATSTQDIFVPWRPIADPSCGTAWKGTDGTCFNGFAFNAEFDLSSLNVTLPNDIIVSLAYNTQTYGTDPIGVDGPYNSLNVLVPNNQPVSIGSDDSASEVFWDTITAAWYTDKGASGVGTFRKDTNWSPNGTIAMQIKAKSPAPPTPQYTVTIKKYVDGAVAAAGTFPMKSTWKAANLSGGNPASGTYALTAGNGYTAVTSPMDAGAEYTTEETFAGSDVGATCDGTKTYGFDGYSIGTDETTAAAGATKSTDAPDFDNLQANQFVIVWNKKCPTPQYTVTTYKYIDGTFAGDDLVNNTATFTASQEWNAANLSDLGFNSNTYSLNPTNGDNNPGKPYTAQTAPLDAGSSYKSNEIIGGNVGATCADGKQYALQGYTVGNTLDEAKTATPISSTGPDFTDIQSDKFVIIWNEKCNIPQYTVTTYKYIDGNFAGDDLVKNTATFTAYQEWDADNLDYLGFNHNTYSLNPTNGDNNPGKPYTAKTAPLNAGSSYKSHEMTDDTVGANCSTGKPYAITGYKTGDSLATALTATATETAPEFTNIQSDKVVIVLNEKCLTGIKVIKKVEGGTANPADFLIHVTYDKPPVTEVGGSPLGGSATGTLYTGLNEVAYTVSETGGPASYTATYSDDCDANGIVNVQNNLIKTCTITNTYVPSCGNAIIDSGEQCDDGNTTDGDACSATCQHEYLQVHILKYLNGAKAISVPGDYQFPMTATWDAPGLGAGSGNYFLGNHHGGAADQYGADTSSMQALADFSTEEITDATSKVLPIGAQCKPGKFKLLGYSESAVSFDDAALQPKSTVAPSFTDIATDRYVIVWNKACSDCDKDRIDALREEIKTLTHAYLKDVGDISKKLLKRNLSKNEKAALIKELNKTTYEYKKELSNLAKDLAHEQKKCRGEHEHDKD